MKKYTKLILGGFPVRLLAEGAFSEIFIGLTEQWEDLVRKVTNAGEDIQIGNTINPDSTNIKIDFDAFIQELDKYDLQAKKFVSDTVKANPNVTYLEMLNLLKEKYL